VGVLRNGYTEITTSVRLVRGRAFWGGKRRRECGGSFVPAIPPSTHQRLFAISRSPNWLLVTYLTCTTHHAYLNLVRNLKGQIKKRCFCAFFLFVILLAAFSGVSFLWVIYTEEIDLLQLDTLGDIFMVVRNGYDGR